MMDMEQLYQEHRTWINKMANWMAFQFSCEHLLEDLRAEGIASFLDHAKDYDPSKGASMKTFLYKHIRGDLRRFAEKHFGIADVEKKEVHLIRKAHAIYDNIHEGTVAERLSATARQMGLPEQEVFVFLSYNSFYSSLDATEFEDGLPLGTKMEQQESNWPTPVALLEDQAYLSALLSAYQRLSYKEKELVGGCFGLFGHKKRTLADLGEEFYLKESAVAKARGRAVVKLFGNMEQDARHAYIKSIPDAIAEFKWECYIRQFDCGPWMQEDTEQHIDIE